MSKVKPTFTGSIESDVTIDRAAQGVKITKDQAFANETIFIKISRAHSEDTIVVPLMPIVALIPMAGAENRSGLIVDATGKNTLFISLADGNIPLRADDQIEVSLKGLVSARSYEVYATETDRPATRLFKYRYDTIEVDKFSKSPDLRGTLFLAVANNVNSIKFTSISGQTQEKDNAELEMEDIYTRTVGKLAYDADVTGYVEQKDTWFLFNVVQQKEAVIESDGTAKVPFVQLSTQQY